jgi:chromosomal replication initiation ATPase DnaA
MKFVSIETATHDSVEQALDAAFARVVPGFIPRCRNSQALKLAKLAADRYGVTVDAIFSERRRRAEVLARRDAWRMARTLGWSLPEIGERFNRDHTTILHGLRQIGGVQ